MRSRRTRSTAGRMWEGRGDGGKKRLWRTGLAGSVAVAVGRAPGEGAMRVRDSESEMGSSSLRIAVSAIARNRIPVW